MGRELCAAAERARGAASDRLSKAILGPCEFAQKRASFYAARMRSKLLWASFSCCAMVAVASATARAQEPAPPAPDDTGEAAAPAAAPASSDASKPEPAPSQAAPATREPAPRADMPPAPPPPPPAREGAYGGRARPQPRAQAAPEGDYEQGAAEPDDDGGGSQKREYSIRLDPFNWLLQGRLGIELEATMWKFISIELVPILVTNTQPPALNYGSFDSALTQHSNGIGPFSGASLGAGFWLSGTPFSGYVLRLYVTNYGYDYQAKDAAGVFDKVSFTERRLVGFFGSHSRFGPFTLAGGLGLGYELNQQERCGLAVVSGAGGAPDTIEGRHDNCNGKQLISLSRTLGEYANLNGSLHPVYLEFRFSLGFVF